MVFRAVSLLMCAVTVTAIRMDGTFRAGEHMRVQILADGSVNAKRKELPTQEQAPDCSNCKNATAEPKESPCCYPVPSNVSLCSNRIPDSMVAFVNETLITEAWTKRSGLWCNLEGGVTESGVTCDPCRPRSTLGDHPQVPGLWCEAVPKDQWDTIGGPLKCYPETEDEVLFVCDPDEYVDHPEDGDTKAWREFPNDPYGGWDWKPTYANKGYPICRKR